MASIFALCLLSIREVSQAIQNHLVIDSTGYFKDLKNYNFATWNLSYVINKGSSHYLKSISISIITRFS